MIDEEKMEEIISSSSDAEKNKCFDVSEDDRAQNGNPVDLPPPIKAVDNDDSGENKERSDCVSESDDSNTTEGSVNNQSNIQIQLLDSINHQLETVNASEQKVFSEIREIHRLYHNEFAGRLTSMQDELEHYRKIDKGRIYDDILGSLARLFSNNESLSDEIQDPKIKKAVRYLLLDIEDVLNEYGMSMIKSNPGDKRDPRHCQIHDRILTEDPSLHDIVVKSYNTGFHIGNRTIIKEKVDIYYFDRTINQTKQDTTSEKTVEDTVEE